MLSSERKTGIISKNCKTNYPDRIQIVFSGIKRELILTTSKTNFLNCEFFNLSWICNKGRKKAGKKEIS